MTKSTCSIEGCERDILNITNGWCRAHYKKWQKYRDPLGCAPNPSPEERFWAKVDKTAACWNWTGANNGRGYGSLQWEGKHRGAHRVCWEILVGPIPNGMHLDHVCHNTMCVNPAHLRLVTHKENQENRRGPARNNLSSGVRGVTKHGTGWRAYVGHNGVLHNFGTYRTIEEAESVAIEARRKLFTHSQN